MVPVDQQIISFVVTIGLGFAMGFVFDFYYIVRCFFKPRKIIIHVTDLLVWLLLTAVVFVVLILTNWGDVRAYVFIGIGVGLITYYRLLSSLVKKVYKFLFELIIKTLSLCVNIILFPFKLFIKGFVFVFSGCGFIFACASNPLRKIVKRIGRSIKIKFTKLLSFRKKIDG
ncbi:MAG: spore cortex biosynthesis protein YabQ [Bacillota bacterium]